MSTQQCGDIKRANAVTAFDRFLSVANGKGFSQVLLMVFAGKEGRDPKSATSDLMVDFSLKPLMYVDKPLATITSFLSLLEDSLENGKPWDLLFVTALDADKFSPSQVNERLELMVRYIHQGETERFLIFNYQGDVVNLNKTAVH